MPEHAVVGAGPEVAAPPMTEVQKLAADILAARERKLSGDISRAQKREIMSFGDVHDCDRHNYYGLAEGDQRSKWDAFVQAKLDAGKARELSIKRELLDLGYEPLMAGEVLEVKDRDGRVLARGRTDLSLALPSNFRATVPMEVKCMQTHMWASINHWRDLLRNAWTRKYVRQLMLYMHSKKLKEGLFLIDDFQGHWKILPVEIDEVFISDAVGKIERAAAARIAGKAPERIPYDHQLCGMCAFQHVCIPDIKQDPRIKVVDNASLAKLLEVRDANYESWQKVEKANAAIKKFFEGVKDGAFTVGNFIITRTMSLRTQYEMPDEIKAKYAVKKPTYKNEIERFTQPDPDTIYMEPKRGFSLHDVEP